MGRESRIEYFDGRERVVVKAHLDSLNITLSAGKKLTVPLAAVKSATVAGDELKIVAGPAKFALKLGACEAELWRTKILNPPSLSDKLGFKAGKTVVLIGTLPDEVVAAAKGASATAVAKLPKALTADVSAIALPPGKEGERIKTVGSALGSGAVWLVYTKGGAINGDDVIGLARKAGLKDTKVARISETYAALRFIKARA